MKKDIFERPVKEALVLMTAPVILGMLTTFLFQLVDTYFVGQLGTSELAAISFAFPVYFLLVSMFMGMASGLSSAVGKALGENNTPKAKRLTTIAVGLFSVLALMLGVVGYYTISPVFSLLGANEEILPLIAEYMQTLYLGIFALVGALVGSAALRAKGITTQPDAILGLSGLVNLVLDYILIFGMGPIPAMGLQGAALATVISWFFVLVPILRLLVKAELLSFKALESFQQTIAAVQEIFTIGLPAVIAQILNPIAIGFITRIVAHSGEDAVAAYGIATKIESLGMTGILALSVILTPLVAQNFGANQQARLDQVVSYSGRMTVYWGLLFFAILLMFGEMIVSIFTDVPEVIHHASNYLYILGLSFPAFGLALITTSFFNGVYMPKDSLKVTLLKSLGFTIPLAAIGSLISLEGVWIGLALANLAGAFYAGKLLNRWLTSQDSSLVGHNPLLDYARDFKFIFSKIARRS